MYTVKKTFRVLGFVSLYQLSGACHHTYLITINGIWLIKNHTGLDHSNNKLVRYSNPHSNFFFYSVKTLWRCLIELLFLIIQIACNCFLSIFFCVSRCFCCSIFVIITDCRPFDRSFFPTLVKKHECLVC